MVVVSVYAGWRTWSTQSWSWWCPARWQWPLRNLWLVGCQASQPMQRSACNGCGCSLRVCCFLLLHIVQNCCWQSALWWEWELASRYLWSSYISSRRLQQRICDTYVYCHNYDQTTLYVLTSWYVEHYFSDFCLTDQLRCCFYGRRTASATMATMPSKPTWCGARCLIMQHIWSSVRRLTLWRNLTPTCK